MRRASRSALRYRTGAPSGVLRPYPLLAVGQDAGQAGLRPHRCRHTYATRLRQGGADPAQVQALLGLASIETATRYFRAGQSEQAAVIERVFE
ncbi:tyrosine-type recombinase/integrase [Nonomuraea sp. NPDC002799]